MGETLVWEMQARQIPEERQLLKHSLKEVHLHCTAAKSCTRTKAVSWHFSGPEKVAAIGASRNGRTEGFRNILETLCEYKIKGDCLPLHQDCKKC